MDDEVVALEFAADVEELVASVREAEAVTQGFADTAKETQDAVAGIAAPAAEAGDAIKGTADSSEAATAALSAYSDEQKAAASAAGDLALAEANVKAAAAEVKGAVADLAAVQATAGKDSTEYAAQLDAVSAAMQRQEAAAAQLKTVQEEQAAVAAQAKTAAEDAATATAATATASEEAAGASATAGAAADTTATKGEVAAAGLGKYKMALVGIGVGAGVAVDAAAKFQAQTTRLVTSAGQSAAGLGQVQQGILQLSSQTGTSTEQLAQGMYIVESAGQHGAAGLEVLKAAAQGARAENSSLEVVADAVSSAMADYHLSADQAATVTTKLVAATSAGKTSFEQLAGAMPAILPVASAAHVSLNDVLGDLASMTLHGMSAQQASQNLADAIRHMQNPTSVQSKELALLGMNTTQLASDMKSSGLSGTINEISQRITNMMPPGSDKVVLQMKTALQGLSPEVQSLAGQLLNGQISMKDYNKAALELNGVQAKQASSFATLLGSTHQIGGAQVSASQVMQNYGQAMAKAMGDATGLNVALMISGENSKNTSAAIKTVSSASTEAGNNVKGWGEITKTTAFQLSKAKDSAEAAGISLGTALLPAVNAILVPLASFLSLIAGNKAAAIAFAVVIGSVLAGAIGTKAVKAVSEFKGAVETTVSGVSKLVGKLQGVKGAADDAASGVEAAAEKSAAAQEAAGEQAWKSSGDLAAKSAAAQEASAEASAASWEASAAQEEAAWAAAGAEAQTEAAEVAAANEEAAAASSGSWIKSAASSVAAGAKWAGSMALSAGKAAAGYAAAAGQAVASWASTAGSLIAQAATWVAGSIAKVAVVVASNVAGAAVSAAAWVAANALMLLGIGAIVALVVIAVVEIVKHWSAIVHGVEAAFDAVKRVVSEAISAVVSFVKSHWLLVVEILTGTALIALVAQHWAQIQHAVLSVVDDVVNFVKQHWQLLLSIVTGTELILAVKDNWSKIKSAFSDGVKDVVSTVTGLYHDVLSWGEKLFDDWISLQVRSLDTVIDWFKGLPGRVVAALGDLLSLLPDSGRKIIQGLINGITSMISSVTSTVSSVVDDIKSFLPFSPAKRGPLSGSGAPENSGRSIGRLLAQGITSSVPAVRSAMGTLAAAADMTAAAAGAGQFGPGSALAAGAVAPAGGATHNVNASVTVNAPAGYAGAMFQDPAFQQYFQREAQEAILRYADNNPGNGLTPAWGR